MVVMGVHVRHVRHRPWLVIAVAVMAVPVVFIVMALMLCVVLDSSGCSQQLGGHQSGVQAVARQQVAVAALLHGMPVVQHHYPVGVPDG
jgi:hypothetical protein